MDARHLGLLLLLVAAAACGGPVEELTAVMTAADALALPRPAPEHRLAYGSDPLQFGELRLPDGEGPYPVVIVIHGGCWLAEYDLGYISALADALTDAGVATWSIEYRRVGDDGGGWPGTFQDVADAADYLLEIATEYDLDLDRVAAVGHSAGGHLALWLAGRKWLDEDDPLRGQVPLPLNGVVALAGITDLAAYAAPDGCGAAVEPLLGGTPSEVEDRFKRASPIRMAPFGITQTLVIGELDPIVPKTQATSFAETALQMGDSVEVVEIAGAGHFELVDPSHAAFQTVRYAVLEAITPGWTE
ncbi:MAG: alpha/beta hydrolase [Thermoanaerobaculales bacterium]|nr:alpha/beta hydrolase [Thermoanaerobaculales bacterium]